MLHRSGLWVLAVGACALLALPAGVWADATTPSNPVMPEGTYNSSNAATFTIPGGNWIEVQDWSWGVSHSTLQSPAGDFPARSFFDVFCDMQILTSGGGSVVHGHGSGPGWTEFHAPAGGTQSFDTEMLSLSLTIPPAGGLGGFMIRESPTEPSRGRTSLTDIGGGQYRVSSFFDVFTELSMDGGASWVPADRAMRMDLVSSVPAPAAVWSGMVMLGTLAGFSWLRRR